jgi:hypothetical protein
LENHYTDILWLLGIFHGDLGYFMTIWYLLCSFGAFYSGFGIMYQEKSGNPAFQASTQKKAAADQGCQIFLGARYQNRKKCTK